MVLEMTRKTKHTFQAQGTFIPRGMEAQGRFLESLYRIAAT
jgi:hypothetical protein